MPFPTRTLAAAALTTALVALTPTVAHAATIDTRTDRSGDVSTLTSNRQPALVRNSVDLRSVTYRIDQATKTLRVTYRTPTVFTAEESTDRGVTQLFSTVILTGDTQFWIDSTNAARTVTTTDSTGTVRTCTGSRSAANPSKDTVTQVVPLACITPGRGAFMSGTYLQADNTGPVFSDTGDWFTRTYRL